MPAGIYVRTEEHKRSISKGLKGRPNRGHFKKGNHPPTEFKKGRHYSPTTEFKKGQNTRSKNVNWKGGRRKDSSGYVLILKPDHPFAMRNGCVFEHRLTIERHLGRYLEVREEVHHIDGIIDDNRIENLHLFPSHSEHQKFHLTYSLPAKLSSPNP
jgi:hypothetical protein